MKTLIITISLIALLISGCGLQNTYSKMEMARIQETAKSISAINNKYREQANARHVKNMQARLGVTGEFHKNGGEKYVYIGMTKQGAAWCLGLPNKFNVTVLENCRQEQWVYDEQANGSKVGPIYLYFDNGILTAYQQL